MGEDRHAVSRGLYGRLICARYETHIEQINEKPGDAPALVAIARRRLARQRVAQKVACVAIVDIGKAEQREEIGGVEVRVPRGRAANLRAETQITLHQRRRATSAPVCNSSTGSGVCGNARYSGAVSSPRAASNTGSPRSGRRRPSRRSRSRASFRSRCASCTRRAAPTAT